MSRKVVFFYPASGIGGAQILFSRIGKHLYDNNVKIVNIDFGDSFISRYFYELGMSFEHIIIDKNSLSKNIFPDDSIFIISPSLLFIINRLFCFSNDTKFLFWELHPDHIIDHTAFSYFYKKNYPNSLKELLKFIENTRLKKIKNVLTIANYKNSFYFMCYRNFIANSDFFNLDFKPSYLPVPQPCIEKNIYRSFKFEDEINIGWVSRLEEDKVNILNLLILDLEFFYKTDSKYRIILHVIGVGTFSDNILKSDYITIVNANEMHGNKLTDYIVKNLDLGFAMGTSALEFASRSLPTLLVPSSTLYENFRKINNRYIWLHDIDGFDVATELYHQQDTLTISDVFSNIEAKNLECFGSASYEYVCKNHSMEEIGNTLMKNLSLLELSYSDIKNTGIYNSNIIEHLFLGLKKAVKKILRR